MRSSRCSFVDGEAPRKEIDTDGDSAGGGAELGLLLPCVRGEGGRRCRERWGLSSPFIGWRAKGGGEAVGEARWPAAMIR
jgi:hypothetical protein